MNWLAVSVHVFTALGSVCALFAMIAVLDHQPEAVFIWLGAALLVDGVDGTLARLAHVKERLPRFSGDRLDLVIDYVTYVFVPVLALIEWRYLDGVSGKILAAGILLSSLYHFSDVASKADDHSFVGFPAIWNAVAFYIFAFDLSARGTAVLVALGIAGTFTILRWTHPMRVVRFRLTTLCATAVFAVAAVATLVSGFPARLTAQSALFAVAAYAVGLTAILNLRRTI